MILVFQELLQDQTTLLRSPYYLMPTPPLAHPTPCPPHPSPPPLTPPHPTPPHPTHPVYICYLKFVMGRHYRPRNDPPPPSPSPKTICRFIDQMGSQIRSHLTAPKHALSVLQLRLYLKSMCWIRLHHPDCIHSSSRLTEGVPWSFWRDVE
jgi:hypothetical protein